MLRYISDKRIKGIEEIVSPFKITFPETIEGAVNQNNFCFSANKEVTLTFSEYQVIRASSYAKYLD